jgi:hypothetical protein
MTTWHSPSAVHAFCADFLSSGHILWTSQAHQYSLLSIQSTNDLGHCFDYGLVQAGTSSNFIGSLSCMVR